jgi:hypothetical protein
VKGTKRPLELVRLLPKGRKKVELLIISTGFALQPCHRSCLASDCVDYRTSWLYLVSPFTMQRYALGFAACQSKNFI